tara:strand:+ start:3878 stop:4222 length:345 start_codon:yes stop_codon:yes gene_type:complete
MQQRIRASTLKALLLQAAVMQLARAHGQPYSLLRRCMDQVPVCEWGPQALRPAPSLQGRGSLLLLLLLIHLCCASDVLRAYALCCVGGDVEQPLMPGLTLASTPEDQLLSAVME